MLHVKNIVTSTIILLYYFDDIRIVINIVITLKKETFEGKKVSRIGPTAKFSYFAGINFRG